MSIALHGNNVIAGLQSREGVQTFQAVNAATGEPIGPPVHEATSAEVDRAVTIAAQTFEFYRAISAEERAAFLERIADGIMALGDDLLHMAQDETALPESRLVGERGRTINQFRMFAELIREGSWLDARIDLPIPDRKPIPKVDLRRMLIPIGPVAVFGASNFPLAYSVAGGDSASALAAGCHIVVKAHPAHPGTSEMVAGVVARAVRDSGLPDGVFSMIHGSSPEVSLQLVRHPRTKAVGFTGSLQAGRALFDAAQQRPEPIPVYAEMGSINPIFVLPGALKERGEKLAEGLVASVTMGVGQFCTNPGVVVGMKSAEVTALVEKAGELAASVARGTMLHKGILNRYISGVESLADAPDVRTASNANSGVSTGQAGAAVLVTNSDAFLQNDTLRHEVFGPSTLIVECPNAAELEKVARELPGQLTVTVHGTSEDLRTYRPLISLLEQKAGRMIINGFPTGVEVCPSMNHGGPYPATTDVRSTSVGTAAIHRFVRPICYQNFPEELLPPELQNNNPRGIWRLIDGKMTRGEAG